MDSCPATKKVLHQCGIDTSSCPGPYTMFRVSHQLKARPRTFHFTLILQYFEEPPSCYQKETPWTFDSQILLLHDNAALWIHEQLKKFKQEDFLHPLYSLDIVRNDFHFFPYSNKKHFHTDDTSVRSWLQHDLPQYNSDLEKLVLRYQKCFGKKYCDYVEK